MPWQCHKSAPYRMLIEGLFALQWGFFLLRGIFSILISLGKWFDPQLIGIALILLVNWSEDLLSQDTTFGHYGPHFCLSNNVDQDDWAMAECLLRILAMFQDRGHDRFSLDLWQCTCTFSSAAVENTRQLVAWLLNWMTSCLCYRLLLVTSWI